MWYELDAASKWLLACRSRGVECLRSRGANEAFDFWLDWWPTRLGEERACVFSMFQFLSESLLLLNSGASSVSYFSVIKIYLRVNAGDRCDLSVFYLYLFRLPSLVAGGSRVTVIAMGSRRLRMR